MKRKQLLGIVLAAGMLVSGLPAWQTNARAAEMEQPVALTQEMVDEANNSYNEKDAALEFISMSDTHVASYESKKWAFENIDEWAEKIGFDANTVLLDGDVEANEREEQPGNSVRFYTAVEQLIEETFGTLPVQFATGNHDIQANMEKVFDEAGWEQYWHYKSKEGNRYNNFYVNINGFDFITLDYRSASTYDAFLRDTLEEIESREDYDPGKPIFIQIHTGVSGTTTGSYQDIGNTTAYLQKALADWPQAIVMTAHSHYGSEVEDGIYQDNFTVVNNGSMDYLEVDDSRTIENEVLNWVQGNMEDRHYELTCNFISVMEDGSTVIRRFDVTNERWMGIPWVINTEEGKEGFQYTTEKRNKVSPWFEEDAKLSVEEVGETTANLVFDQAVDDQLVEYYKVTVKDFLTNEDASYKVLPENYDYAGDSSYEIPKGVTGSFEAYSRYYLRPYPEQMKFYLSGLEQNTRYRVIVQAYDSFDNASKVEDMVFKTGGESEELPNTLPETIEDGKFVDMNFDNSDLTDSEGKITAKSSGSVTFEDGFKGKAIHIASGSKNYVDLGKNDAMNLDENDSLTMNFWIYSNSANGDSSIISNKNWSSGGNPGWYVGFRLSNLNSVGVNAADGSTRIDYDGYDSFAGNWKMVTVTFDRTEQVTKIYIDGKESANKDLSSIGSMQTDYSVKIGSDGTGNYRCPDFLMDNLQMWNRALTDDEILAIYGTAVYEEDTTDYDAKLNELISQAESMLEEYETAQQGFTYDEEIAARLKEQVEQANTAQTTEEKQVFCAEIAYLMERLESSRQWTFLDKSAFTVAECDSWHGDHGEGDYGESRLYAPEKAIDGNTSTAWHTNWTNSNGEAAYPFPHSIIIDLGDKYELSGIRRLGRGERDYIKDFTVEASNDLELLKAGNGEGKKVQGNFADQEDAVASFGQVLTGRYIKLTIHNTWLMEEEGSEGKQWTYVSELDFTGQKAVQEETEISTAVLKYALELAQTADTDGVISSVADRFQMAVSNGQEILAKVLAGDETVTQAMVDQSWRDIISIMQYLSFKQGDKTDLGKVIEMANGLDLNLYLEESKEGFEDALNIAEKTYADQDAMQTEVDAVWTALLKEMSELRLIPDKDALGALIQSASVLKGENYETESFVQMRAALAQAQNVYTDDRATKEEVEDAAVNLGNALDGLVANAVSTDKTGAQTNSAENSDSVKADETRGKTVKKSVKTGDASSATGASSLAVMGLAAAVLVMRRKRR